MLDTFIIFANLIMLAGVLIIAGSGAEGSGKAFVDDAREPWHVDAVRGSARWSFLSDLLYGFGIIAAVNAVLFVLKAIFG